MKSQSGAFRKIAGDPLFLEIAFFSVLLHLYSVLNLEYHRDEMLYFDEEPGEDLKALFRRIDLFGTVSDPHAREFGTTVYLCSDPAASFNQARESRLKRLYTAGD